MIGHYTRLGEYWARIETHDDQSGIMFLRIDQATLEKDEHTYHEALEFLRLHHATGEAIPAKVEGTGYRVLAVLAIEERQVIRVKIQWVAPPT